MSEQWRERLADIMADHTARRARARTRRAAFAAARRFGLPRRQAAKLAAEAARRRTGQNNQPEET